MSTRAAATPQAAARGKIPPISRAGAHAAPKKRRAHLTGRAAVLLVVVMLILMTALAPLRNLLDQRSQMAELQRQAVTLQRQNDALQQQVAQLNDPVFLQRLARECLGMVMPGEIAFRTIPKHGAPTPPDC